MLKINSKKIFSFLLLLIVNFSIITLCASADSIVDTSSSCYTDGSCQLSDFSRLAVRIANFIWAISGSLALLAFVYGGFLFLTSAGMSDRVTKGRQTLIGAIIGLAIVFGSWLIVYYIMKNILGVTMSFGLG